MARGRAKRAEQPAIAPPPSVLGKAAADPTSMWVLDIHTPWGRRVHFGPLADVEVHLPEGFVDDSGAAPMAPDHTVWLFPVTSSFHQAKYRKMSKRGWMRTTRWGQ